MLEEGYIYQRGMIFKLDIVTILNVDKEQFNYGNLQQLYVFELGIRTYDGGLYVIDDNDGIMKILSKINVDIDVLEFFDNHEIGALIYALNIHFSTNLEKATPSGEDELDAPPGFEGPHEFF